MPEYEPVISLEDAKEKIERRRKGYNEFKPYSTPTYLASAEFTLKTDI
jgi:hypothetical protein